MILLIIIGSILIIAGISLKNNQNPTTNQNLLFVESKLIGKYESKKAWKKNSIIDIYRIGIFQIGYIKIITQFFNFCCYLKRLIFNQKARK